MRYTLIIRHSATQSESAKTALRFGQSLLAKGHSINRVFFYQDAVQLANEFQHWPTDESNVSEQWKSFVEENSIDLIVCIAAGLRRGIVNKEEAARYGKNGANLHPPFELTGLGQLVVAIAESDRTVQF